MSAFIVNYKTIDNILSIRLNHNLLNEYCYFKSEFQTLVNVNDFDIYEGLDELGKEFLKLNIDSVNDRYSEQTSYKYAENYHFKDSKASLGQAIKSLDCLIYQSCEIDNYKENKTFIKMEKLRKYLVNMFLYLNDEYKNAEWDDQY